MRALAESVAKHPIDRSDAGNGHQGSGDSRNRPQHGGWNGRNKGFAINEEVRRTGEDYKLEREKENHQNEKMSLNYIDATEFREKGL